MAWNVFLNFDDFDEGLGYEKKRERGERNRNDNSNEVRIRVARGNAACHSSAFEWPVVFLLFPSHIT